MRFNLPVYVGASLAAAAILVSIVAIPQWLIKQARWDDLHKQVEEVAELAAGVVDGDLHRRLLDSANYSDELYAEALRPLVRLHSASPEIFYLYTMAPKGSDVHFILDTAASPDLRTTRDLQPSPYMQRFKRSGDHKDDWLGQIGSGKSYVTPTFEQDEYGTFLTGHAPIYDRQNNYVGFVGVDYDVGYYVAREARYRYIETASLLVAVILSLGIGYLVALLYSTLQQQLIEGERERVARDIHDGVLQALTAAELQLKVCANTADPHMRAQLDETRHLLVEEHRRVRSFVEDTRLRVDKREFMRGEDSKAFFKELERRWNCEISFVREPNDAIEEGIPADLRLMLAEAVANAVKHGKADRVTIRVERSPHTLDVGIDDNGKGFPDLSGTYENDLLSTMKEMPRSIYERVQELGGRMTLFTSPEGSRLQIQLPLS